MVARRGFDVPGAKPAGLSYISLQASATCALQVRPSVIEPGVPEHLYRHRRC